MLGALGVFVYHLVSSRFVVFGLSDIRDPQCTPGCCVGHAIGLNGFRARARGGAALTEEHRAEKRADDREFGICLSAHATNLPHPRQKRIGILSRPLLPRIRAARLPHFVVQSKLCRRLSDLRRAGGI